MPSFHFVDDRARPLAFGLTGNNQAVDDSATIEFGLAACQLWLPRKEPVRSELARLEKQNGLTLATFYRGIDIVSFDDRSLILGRDLMYGYGKYGSISRDGTEIAEYLEHLEENHAPTLGIIRSDGSNFHDYLDIPGPLEMCWSYDKSKLALTLPEEVHGKVDYNSTSVAVLDLNSNLVQQIVSGGRVTSQCWSADDRQIVYEMYDAVTVHDIGKDKSDVRVLAKGAFPTWSPDGRWIAFLDQDTYYAIRPTGKDRRVLFHRRNAISGLYWSPDSRIVAYVSQVGLLDGVIPPLDAEVNAVWVRRLADGSNFMVNGTSGYTDYEWVTNKQLIETVESKVTAR